MKSETKRIQVALNRQVLVVTARVFSLKQPGAI